MKATNPEQKKAEFGGFSTSGNVTLVVSSADHGMRVECHAYSSVLSEGVNTFYQLTVLCKYEVGMGGKFSSVLHLKVNLPKINAKLPKLHFHTMCEKQPPFKMHASLNFALQFSNHFCNVHRLG